jgi:1-acyl-sn-glycerol-3-phosphate acyltransferase
MPRSDNAGPAQTMARPTRLPCPGRGARAGSRTRARLWSLTFAVLADGVEISTPDRTPPLLPAGCVVVANHCSHADTAVVLAALGRLAPLRVAAAADYWFASKSRTAIARAAVGAFPVWRSRPHGYDPPAGQPYLGGLELSMDWLACGGAVVVFPEGTRSRDGRQAAFKAGAFRLAASAGVPIVPVGLAGTRTLLPPKGERLNRAPVHGCVGSPIGAAAAANGPQGAHAIALAAGEEVARLADLAATRLPTRRG